MSCTTVRQPGCIVEVGIPGPAGASTASYVYEQVTPALVWTFTHPLNKWPAITVVDSADNIVIADVQYLSESEIKITLAVEAGGRVFAN